VSDTGGGVRIVMPMPRTNPLVIVGALLPAVVAMSMLAWLGFFSVSRPLTPGEWIFFGVLFVGFTLIPAASAVNLWLRSRLGRSIVSVSTEGVRLEERTAFRTRTKATVAASDVLDVDYSTKESAMASARHDAEKETAIGVLSAFLKGKGIIVKSRQGFTTFGEGLGDDEIRYLHGVVARALAGRT